jgi:hypothetical protein
VSDDWLDQLRKLHDADKARSQAKSKEQQVQKSHASDLLRQSQAHKLLRQVQKVLLSGQGTLDIFDRTGDYERVISLVWQGPISNARKPNPDDPEPYNYILVGVRNGKLWVNGKALSAPTPEALKVALVQASQKPGREKRGQ